MAARSPGGGGCDGSAGGVLEAIFVERRLPACRRGALGSLPQPTGCCDNILAMKRIQPERPKLDGSVEKGKAWRVKRLPWCASCLTVLVMFTLGQGNAEAQATAEAAGASSVAASAGASVHAEKKVSFPTSAKKDSKFRHLPAGISESPEKENRRALEEEAGEDAGTVLLRSTPSDARVWIDSKLVGRTPLLLVLAPGGYHVEMRGKRMSSAEKDVDILPEEKREILVRLHSRYPAQVQLGSHP